MRPFRFFFVLSLGIFIFLFVARFLVMALFVAAVLSFGFFLVRKVRNFFYHLNWDGNNFGGQQHAHYHPMLRYETEPLFDLPHQQHEPMPRYRKIKIQ